MGARIEAVGLSRSRRGPFGRGSIRLADEAARRCLARAGREARELDFLINAGVYRDRNLAEPALAAIIQHDIHAEPAAQSAEAHGTFSLDIVNGACGVLNAVHVLDGFLDSGAIDLGMVVTSDADPHRGLRWGARFPYDPTGGALLLSRGGADRGFTHFSFSTFPELSHLYDASVQWEEGGLRRVLATRLRLVRPGRNVLRIREDPSYAASCAECAVRAAFRFLHEVGLQSKDVDLLLASPTPVGLGDALARALELPDARVIVGSPRFSGGYTAGLLIALEQAVRAGQLQGARCALLATAAPGISVGLALYRS